MFTNIPMIKVHKNNLLLFTGSVWFIASMILLLRAYSWVEMVSRDQLVVSGIVAIILAMVKIHFVFRKLTMQNIQRIITIKEKAVSLLHFHLIKDQILIILMIVLGIILRNSPIHKSYLLPVYTGIGIAMFYSSVLYIKYVIKKRVL
jgi:hypothetical protein